MHCLFKKSKGNKRTRLWSSIRNENVIQQSKCLLGSDAVWSGRSLPTFRQNCFTTVYPLNFYQSRLYPIQEGHNRRSPWPETSQLARLVQVSARKAVLNVHLPPEPVTWTGHPPLNMQVRNASRKFFRR